MKVEHLVNPRMGNNIYIVIDEVNKKAALIDPSFRDPALTNHLEQADFDLLYVIATHGHQDHIQSIEDIAKKFSAKSMIHHEDEFMMRTDLHGRKVGEYKADIKLNDGDIVEVGDLRLEIIHTPGHSGGGICIRCENYLFTGDTLFRDEIGRCDLLTGSYEVMINTLKNILGKIEENLTVCPGHGEFSTLEYEKKNNKYFKV